jgi:DNA polymerase (family 10)
VAGALREIGQLLEVDRADPHRARAYRRGAQAVESLAADLRQLVKASRLTSVPGIGARLAETIRELLDTGTCRLLERLRAQYPPGVLELRSVLSLTRIRALHDALGVTSLDELREACASGAVRGVPGFGPRTERRILDAIDARTARGDAQLLPEAEAQGARVLAYLRRTPVIGRVELAGEFRRRVETVSRLDLVLASSDPAAAIAHAERLPASVAAAAEGETAVSLRPADGLPIHVRAVGEPDFAAAWVHATGSDDHLAKLSQRARAAGLEFDGHGLRRDGQRLPLADEPALYRALDLPFIPPELREDAGEIEAAAAGALPDDLIAPHDVRGAVHCHTVDSDGRNTIEEMARAAEALGMGYLTITDHSPTAGYAGGLSVERLRRQWDEIARVQERVAIRLLRGTEADILRDGALDFPDAVLRDLDVVIASIHARHGLDAATMTRRLVRALRHPLFKIWGHPLGRYVLTRAPFACDMEQVLDVAAKSPTAIEINGDPHRLDLEPRWIREARRRGVRFVISSDAHSTGALGNFRWGVDMARRGWVGRGEVLNALPAEEFRTAVRP